jgi:plasmid stabilization system protein ParE
MIRAHRRIITRFGWIARTLLLGKTRDDIKAGYWLYQEGKHVVFYLIDSDAVYIVGVLHDKMVFLIVNAKR